MIGYQTSFSFEPGEPATASRPGRGQHIATASFPVAPVHQGRGVGRALAEHVIGWAPAAGYHGIQFNPGVEINHTGIHLWKSLGFELMGTVPEAFNHPEEGLVGLHVIYRRLK